MRLGFLDNVDKKTWRNYEILYVIYHYNSETYRIAEMIYK